MESGDDKLKTQPWKLGALLVPVAFMLCFGLFPIATVIWRLLDNSAAAPMMVSAGDIGALALSSSMQAGLSTALGLLVGLPTAFLLSLFEFRGRRLVYVLVFVPFILPTVVTGLALRGLLSAYVPQGLWLVLVGHTFVNVAVVVRFVGAALESLDQRFITQARTLGSSRARAWWTVGWPLVGPAIGRAASLVFVYCFSSLGLLLVLGDRTTRTFESQVLREVSLLLDFRAAAAHTLAQMVLVGAVLWLGGRRAVSPTAMSGGVIQSRRPLSAGWRVLVAGIVGAYLSPFVWLVQQSVVVSAQVTPAYWSRVWADEGFVAVFIKSAGLAACVGVIASLVASMAAIAATEPRLRRWSRVVLAPMLFTSATIGLGMLLSYSREPFSWQRAAAPLIIAQALLVLPIAYVTVASRLDEVDENWQVVARSLGASPIRAFFSSYGNRLMVGALSAAGLCAAIAAGEYGAASFLSDFQSPTLSVYLMRQLSRPGEASMAIASVAAIGLAVVAVGLLGGFERLSRVAGKVRH